jgi:hypothetical protein
MKKIFFLVSLGSSIITFAQNINFQDNMEFSEILKKAKTENKIIFLDAYASWCGPCKMMEKNVFNKESVQEYYNANFINVRFDMEKGEGMDLARIYGVRSYPTFLFIDGDGKIIYKSMGYQPEKEFLETGKNAKKTTEEVVTKRLQFEKGEKDLSFLKQLFFETYKIEIDFAKKVAERYFQNKKDKNFSKEEAFMLFNILKSSDSPYYQLFIDNKTEITKYISEKAYSDFDTSIKLNTLLQEAINKEINEIDDEKYLKNAVNITSEKEANKVLNDFKMNYYFSVKNFDKFTETSLKYFQNENEQRKNKLMEISYIIAENVKNKDLLTVPTKWVEKSVNENENLDNTYILAKLYFTMEKNSDAKIYALKSFNLSKKIGRNTDLQEKLLKEIK